MESVAVEHEKSHQLVQYWQRMRGSRRAPERADIEPADIRAILPNAVMLECGFVDEYPVRIAGTAVCGLFKRDLKGTDFLSVWQPHERHALVRYLATLRQQGAGVRIGWSGHSTRYHKIEGEMVILPLARDDRIDRAIATFVPFVEPYWAGTFPIKEIQVDQIAPISLRNDIPLRRTNRDVNTIQLVNQPIKTVQHLTVYEGGRRGDS